MEVLNNILDFLRCNPASSRTEIMDYIDASLSATTIKRLLLSATEQGLIKVEGKGKATKYSITPNAHVLMTLNLDDYFNQEIDERTIISHYNFDLIEKILSNITLFTHEELIHLNSLHQKFIDNISNISPDRKSVV